MGLSDEVDARIAKIRDVMDAVAGMRDDDETSTHVANAAGRLLVTIGNRGAPLHTN